jgi:hypothetical protein
LFISTKHYIDKIENMQLQEMKLINKYNSGMFELKGELLGIWKLDNLIRESIFCPGAPVPISKLSMLYSLKGLSNNHACITDGVKQFC